jgi:hypothetical protein
MSPNDDFPGLVPVVQPALTRRVVSFLALASPERSSGGTRQTASRLKQDHSSNPSNHSVRGYGMTKPINSAWNVYVVMVRLRVARGIRGVTPLLLRERTNSIRMGDKAVMTAAIAPS